MMYKDNFVLAIKVNNKVLREFKDVVYLPFGSEYTLHMKNLSGVRALAKVWIDGKLVTEGLDLIVGSNDYIDLERFLSNKTLAQGNKFKFIERTSAIEEHRGIEAEDGLVRVQFQFEKIYKPVFIYDHINDVRGVSTQKSIKKFGINNDSFQYTSEVQYRDTLSCDTSLTTEISKCSVKTNDVGITSFGSISDQKFNLVSGFPVESEVHTIVLKLLGEKADKAVDAAVTVKTKPECVMCGRKNKATTKFCSECGTSLQIV